MKAFRKIICLIAILLTVTMLFACNGAGGDGGGKYMGVKINDHDETPL